MSFPGSFDYDPPESEASSPATVVQVFRYDGEGGYEEMPNIQVLEVQKREGLEPMTAQLAYILDEVATAFGWPAEFEQIMALSSASGSGDPDSADAGRYVIQPDERLVIFTTDAGGVSEILFDGFAQTPQVNFAKGRQQVSFTAIGTPVRLFAYPVMDYLTAWDSLKADEVPSPTEYQGVVQGPARFNPDGVPNCTPDEIWFRPDDGDPCPIFYRDSGIDAPDVVEAVPWSLADAARYILAYHLGDSEFVDPPDVEALDRILDRRMPKAQDPSDVLDPALFYDPDDPDTYIEEPIIIRDFDMSGMRWPDALDQLLSFSGFAAEFVTQDRGDGTPRTSINIYRKDAGGPYDPKTIGLQPRRATLKTSESMVEAFGIVRDYKDAFNAVTMDAYPAIFEVSIVLAMRGPIDAGDAIHPEEFSAGGEQGDSPRYRVWYADELGLGHVARDGSISTDAFDFGPIFSGIYDPAVFNPIPTPLRRPRPSLGELVSLGDDGLPKRPTLYFSRDYAGDTAKPWDGTGTWQKLAHGWELMDERFGVRLTADNLEAWTIGEDPYGKIKAPIVRVITSMAVNSGVNTRFSLRLDGAVEADVRGFNDFPSRKASALKWDRYRYLSGKGSYRVKFIHESSPDFSGSRTSGGNATSYDRKALQAGYTWMAQSQTAGEDPALAGPITIPWHTRAYRVGDRISAIDGRGLSLRVNQGTDNGEAPAYPFVVGVSWSFGDKEQTTLDLSDYRSPIRAD